MTTTRPWSPGRMRRRGGSPSASGTVITGARFRPGGIRAVFGCSATTILNRAVLLWILQRSDPPARAASPRRSVRQRQLLLADWIRAALCRTRLLDRRVRAACRWLTIDPRVDISAVAQRFDWNVRTIRRDFHAACGYGPSTSSASCGSSAPFASPRPVALEPCRCRLAAGYADQAHMTRDFRDITGFTPAQHLATTSAGVRHLDRRGLVARRSPFRTGCPKRSRPQPLASLVWRRTISRQHRRREQHGD